MSSANWLVHTGLLELYKIKKKKIMDTFTKVAGLHASIENTALCFMLGDGKYPWKRSQCFRYMTSVTNIVLRKLLVFNTSVVYHSAHLYYEAKVTKSSKNEFLSAPLNFKNNVRHTS